MLFVLVILVALGFYFLITLKPKNKVVVENRYNDIVRMCYLYSSQNTNGLVDQSYVRMNILDQNVAGEFGFCQHKV